MMEDGKTPVVMEPSQTIRSWLTLLQTNHSNGLEVKSGLLGRWLPVSGAVPGSLLVITGDILEAATRHSLDSDPSKPHLSRGALYRAENFRIKRPPRVKTENYHHATLMNMSFVYSRPPVVHRLMRAASRSLDLILDDDRSEVEG